MTPRVVTRASFAAADMEMVTSRVRKIAWSWRGDGLSYNDRMDEVLAVVFEAICRQLAEGPIEHLDSYVRTKTLGALMDMHRSRKRARHAELGLAVACGVELRAHISVDGVVADARIERRAERDAAVREAMETAAGHVPTAAAALGITPQALRLRLRAPQFDGVCRVPRGRKPSKTSRKA